MQLILFATFFVLLNQQALARPSGAPDSACVSMMPGHGALPQTLRKGLNSSPFLIQVSKDTDNLSYKISVVRNKGFPGKPHLKGFLIQVREQGKNAALGEFTNLPSYARKGGCKEGSVTHTNNNLKPIDGGLQFSWLPKNLPSSARNFQVLGTFVQDFDTFWVKVPSSNFQVSTKATPQVIKPTNTFRNNATIDVSNFTSPEPFGKSSGSYTVTFPVSSQPLDTFSFKLFRKFINIDFNGTVLKLSYTDV